MQKALMILTVVLGLLLGLLTWGCQSSNSADSGAAGFAAGVVDVDGHADDDDDDDDDDEFEENIPLDEVPDHVLDAALRALPGIQFFEAEREVERGILVYELTGLVDGVAYEVEVTEDGRVIEIEQDD